MTTAEVELALPGRDAPAPDQTSIRLEHASVEDGLRAIVAWFRDH
jgi:hypothetical protein